MNNLLNNEKFFIAYEILRALTHPVRLEIIEYIAIKKQINVNSIYSSLKLDQSITSQHLFLLKKYNLVTTHRKGKYIYYSINHSKNRRIERAIFKFIESKKR